MLATPGLPNPPIIMEVENDPKWRGNDNWREPFFTSMIMGGRVEPVKITRVDRGETQHEYIHEYIHLTFLRFWENTHNKGIIKREPHN